MNVDPLCLTLAVPMHHEPQIEAESVALMQALLARPGVGTAAAEAFRRAYPDAPPAMIDTAVHHVVSEGIQATVDWLAAIERFIRDPSAGLDYGAVWHVVYHLYNWQQFQALMPLLGRDGLKEHLRDVREFLEENDKQSALDVLKRLASAIEGDVSPPEVG
jgi:hypothetical protein